ncbi:hypothetical protein [Streptomyces agglomeratus]|uniref:hypothetical protein n=1 Tax=Streptomyces agglomeratus TaxID=285458 RepID=UPI001F0A9C5B|nr:hypothetical protein [Streptomyces agglomeratus]
MGQPHWVPGLELRAILTALEELHGAYNFDGSDSCVGYVHVNYYGQVEGVVLTVGRRHVHE